MTRFSLRLPDSVLGEARRWAERDGVSLNDWIAAAVDRETVRRRLEAHNEWAKASPLYTVEHWEATQRDIAEALRDNDTSRGAA
jgi:hypothetical protein